MAGSRTKNSSKISDDKQLIDRLLAGDRGAFDKFFEENAPGLYHFALARLGYDEELAKEIVQTTLCKAIESIETYRGEASLFTWLSTCCVYEIQRQTRKRHRAPIEVELTDAVLENRTPDRLPKGPEDNLRRMENRELVHATLARLQSDHSEILGWKYIDDLAVAEIAHRLGVSPKAAESKLTRARVAFRRRFTIVAADPGIWKRLKTTQGAVKIEDR